MRGLIEGEEGCREEGCGERGEEEKEGEMRGRREGEERNGADGDKRQAIMRRASSKQTMACDFNLEWLA